MLTYTCKQDNKDTKGEFVMFKRNYIKAWLKLLSEQSTKKDRGNSEVSI